jgi:hypothetical protein
MNKLHAQILFIVMLLIGSLVTLFWSYFEKKRVLKRHNAFERGIAREGAKLGIAIDKKHPEYNSVIRKELKVANRLLLVATILQVSFVTSIVYFT